MKKENYLVSKAKFYLDVDCTTLLCSIRVDAMGYPFHFYSKRGIDELANKPFMSALTCVCRTTMYLRKSLRIFQHWLFLCVWPHRWRKRQRAPIALTGRSKSSFEAERAEQR